MADPGKTESATPKKREDARKKGQVARSIEINSVLNVLITVVMLKVSGEYMLDAMKTISGYFWGNAFTLELNPDTFGSFMTSVIIKLVLVLLPVLVAVFVVAILSNVLQVGFQVSFEPLKPKFDNINPSRGFKRIFSRRTLFELAKAIVKIGIIGYLFYSSVKKILAQIFATPLMDIETYLAFAAAATMNLIFKVLAAYAVFAFVDYIYQRWDFEDNLKMSKQEVKDEHKQMEGDPLVKARIRNIQREMARKRMISEIPQADVVITNPTHVAVAVRYEEKGERAPVIVAKGRNYMAEKIKEIARKSGVIIVENPPLARTLEKLEVGWEIPPDLFQAVAEILAYVYQAKGKIRLEEKGKKVDNKTLNDYGIIPDLGGNA